MITVVTVQKCGCATEAVSSDTNPDNVPEEILGWAPCEHNEGKERTMKTFKLAYQIVGGPFVYKEVDEALIQ